MPQRVSLHLAAVATSLVLGTLACSKGGSGQPLKQPDGSYHLECKSPLSACLERAEHLCQGQGYVVSEARDRHELLGHEQGQSQVEVQQSEATIFCGGESTPPPRAMVEVTSKPVTRTRPERSSDEPNPYPESEEVCVPGSTQACVGPAGCQGGQACSADGTHFDPCDCGTRN